MFRYCTLLTGSCAWNANVPSASLRVKSFPAVALPLTYIPILLVANDREYMGAHKNGRLANTLGITYLVLIMVIAIAAIPLMLITNVGQN